MRISTSIGLLLRPRRHLILPTVLFLTAANLGTALGSAVCGMVIAHMGMQYMMWGGIVFLILCLAMIIPRVYRSDEYVCLGESK